VITKTNGKDPYIYCVHRLHDQRMCVDCHDAAIRNARQKENERLIDIAESHLIPPEDEEHDNKLPEGAGTSHNKAVRGIVRHMRIRARTAQEAPQ